MEPQLTQYKTRTELYYAMGVITQRLAFSNPKIQYATSFSLNGVPDNKPWRVAARASHELQPGSITRTGPLFGVKLTTVP
jgi:hypothetical protein